MKPVIIGGPARIFDYALMSTERIFAQTGNTGNLAFRYAIDKHLGRTASFVSWADSAEKVHATGEIAVLPCANQLGSHANHSARAELISKLRIPVLAIGLGAQSKSTDEFPEVSADTARWVHAIAERRAQGASNITVRGEFTRRVLERIGIRDGVEVLGCPSLFISDDRELGQTIAARLARTPRRIGVAASNPGRPVSIALERGLMAIAQQSGGSYVVQHPLPFIKAARGEFADLDASWQERIRAFVDSESPSDGAFRLPSNTALFFDVDAWMENLRRHDLVVGMRIHGTMLAIQAGVPALCVTHDSRTEELCQTMGIPNVSAHRLSRGNLDVQTILSHIDFDPEKFDRNRMNLAQKYGEFLRGCGLQFSSGLARAADAIDTVCARDVNPADKEIQAKSNYQMPSGDDTTKRSQAGALPESGSSGGEYQLPTREQEVQAPESQCTSNLNQDDDLILQELVQQAKRVHPALLDLPDSLATRLLTATFEEINQRVRQAKEVVLKVPGVGHFEVKPVEPDLDGKKANAGHPPLQAQDLARKSHPASATDVPSPLPTIQRNNATSYNPYENLFAAVGQTYLPEKPGKILSFGCSNGDEPLSLSELWFPEDTHPRRRCQ